MARGRFVSKAISLDEKVDALSSDTVRLLFTWLITHLDCEGRMYGDAQTVKSIVFPRRSMKAQVIEKYLVELENQGLILRYSAPGGNYLCMKNFEKHQPGLNKDRESQSQIPPITPELIQSKVGEGLTQVKVKEETKQEVKEESSSCSKEDVLEVYEKEIGAVTETMENEIELAIKQFTASWVRDAIREAMKRNKRTWVYIAGILKNWRKYGKDAETPSKFTKGKYQHLAKR